MIKYYLGFLFILISLSSISNTVITYRNSDGINDDRFNYEVQLLELALSKTIDSYGSYTLQSTPKMNTPRSIMSIETNRFENFFMLTSFKSQYNKSMNYIPIPLQRGVVGYRVFLTTKKGEMKLNALGSKEQLKQLTVVQGHGWQDVNILRNYGFQITALSNYDSMFQFLSRNRADIFPRGVSEYEFEMTYHSAKATNLVLDTKYALYYEFPRFFYTNKANKKAYQRIYEGLTKAWHDGSFIALWERYHLDNINKANLETREILVLDNPEMKFLSEDINKYLYKVDRHD